LFCFFIQSYAIADATKIDEYVPKPIPINNANINPFILSPPKINIAKITSKVVIDVLKVLPRVLLIESSKSFERLIFFFSLMYSLGVLSCPKTFFTVEILSPANAIRTIDIRHKYRSSVLFVKPVSAFVSN